MQMTVDQAMDAALAHQREGRLAEAEGLYRQILALVPEHGDALYWLGILAISAGKVELGMDLARRGMLAFGTTGVSPERLYNLSVALGGAGRLEEAVAVYREALRLNPDFVPVLMNLGTVLSWQGKDAEAEGLFRRAVEREPQRVEGWTNLGNALRRNSRWMEAVACHERAIVLQPGFVPAYSNLGTALKDLGRATEAVAMFRKGLEIAPEDARIWSNFLLTLFYDPTMNAANIFEEHRRWGTMAAAKVAHGMAAHPNDRNEERRLRVGYVSPDFRNHSVGFFLDGLLASHDPRAVEVFCYADGLHKDAMTARMRGYAHHWRECAGRTDDQVAETIRQDQIDILVDLAGHTAGNRMMVFARKPAPVQVSYLGYLGTTGLRAIDYRMTDAHADPPGETERFYTEELVRLPGTFACYRPAQGMGDVCEPPSSARGHVTFGSFNMLAKLTDATLATWAEILRRCAGSRMVIVAGGLEERSACDRLRSVFVREGVEPDRVELRGSMEFPSYIAAHREIDVVLDSFPVNGHTVTCHALWMGVPVVALAGETYCGRLGASVLTAIGLADLVGKSRGEYVQIAAALAHDSVRLTTLRSEMRERMVKSPLMDTVAVARGVEAGYREMWRRWCGRGT